MVAAQYLRRFHFNRSTAVPGPWQMAEDCLLNLTAPYGYMETRLKASHVSFTQAASLNYSVGGWAGNYSAISLLRSVYLV